MQMTPMRRKAESKYSVTARVIAWLVDVGLIIFVCVHLEEFLLDVMETTELEAYVIAGALAAMLFLMKDAFNGQSVGKRIAGLRVVAMDTKKPIGAMESIKRNGIFLCLVVLAVVLVQGTYYALVDVSSLLTDVLTAGIAALVAVAVVAGVQLVSRLSHGQTLGDRMAGTVVVASRTVVYQPSVSQSPETSQTMRDPSDKYYKVAALELELNRLRPEIWERAVSSAKGEQSRYGREYIKHRVAQLKNGGEQNT